MKYRVDRLSIHQTSKILALSYSMLVAIFTLPAGLFFLIIGSPDLALQLFLVPMALLTFYYCSSVIACWFYNFISRAFGGIEFHLKEIKEEEKQSTPEG